MTYEELEAVPLKDRIKWVRKQHGPTQAKFAEKLGTSSNRVVAWENGRSGVSEEYAAKIAELAGYPVELFMPKETEALDVMAEIAGQLQQQTLLLSTLTDAGKELRGVIVELRGLIDDLREVISAGRRPGQRRKRG